MLIIHSIVALCLMGVLALQTTIVESRCGYPDLPYQAYLVNFNNEPLIDWLFFEDNQLMKVICQNGLIGQFKNKSNEGHKSIEWPSSSSSSSSFMSIQFHAIIQCQDNRWNTSGLYCMRNVNIEWNSLINNQTITNNRQNVDILAHVTNLKINTDNHNRSDGCVELSKNNTVHGQNITFDVQLKNKQLDTKERPTITRLVLIVQNQYQNAFKSKIDNYILEHHLANHLNNSEENAEIEENKRFLDFVHWNELFANDNNKNNDNNHSSTMAAQQWQFKNALLNHKEIKPNEQQQKDQQRQRLTEKSYIISTSFAMLALSVKFNHVDHGNGHVKWHECYFNDDVSIGQLQQSNNVNTTKVTTTEFIIFDCPFNNTVQTDSFRIEINVRPKVQGDEEHNNGNIIDSIQLCQMQVFIMANDDCGSPSIPINGLVNKITRPGENGQQIAIAQYSCTSQYRIADMKHELQSGLNVHHNGTNQPDTIERYCHKESRQWLPDVSDVLCLPKHWCRNPPPMPDATKFLFEYSKLDNMNRAIADMSLATLRCIMVTHNVVPFTIYRCGPNGQWIKLGQVKNRSEPQPSCILSKYRAGGASGYRGGYRRYRYYHYYPTQSSSNMNTLLWGHRLTDNKYLTYYGAAGIVILFLGSFIILIHVRRMAKNMSTQMREQAYMNMDKNANDAAFMSMNGGSCPTMSGGHSMDMDNPPDYYNETNFFETNTMYSNDLPPPTTPISMPSTLNNSVGSSSSGSKHKNQLSANFDSIKF